MNSKKKTQLLYLSANPEFSHQEVNFEELGLTYEATYLRSGIRRSRSGTEINLNAFYHVQFEKMKEYIDQYQPDILHLACQYEKDQLIFAGEGKNARIVSPTCLIDLLKSCEGQIKLLVLRIYGSKELANRIFEETGIPAVLHLGNRHDAETIHEFIGSFYQLLGNGINLRRAFNLARKTSGVRLCELTCSVETGAQPIMEPALVESCFALLCASTPTGKSKLPFIAAEIDTVSHQFPGGSCQSIYPYTKQDVLMAIAYYQPRVILFSGHGSMDHISFYDENQNKMKIDKQWLVDVFGEFRDQVECVVFNSCENMALSYAVSRHIPYVIGTKKNVGDDVALVVTNHFFHALLQNPEQPDYPSAFRQAKEDAMFTPGWSLAHLNYLTSYTLFQRSLYHDKKNRQARRTELMMISREELLTKNKKYKNDRYLKQFDEHFQGWINQIHNSRIQELAASFARNISYISSSAITKYYQDEYELIVQGTEPDRTAYFPYREDRNSHSEGYCTFFQLINGVDSGSFHDQLKDEDVRIGELFDLILITDFISSFKQFQSFYEKYQDILKKKRVTMLTICAMEQTLADISAFAKKEHLDLKIKVLKELKPAFCLYPKYDRQMRNFEKYCIKELGMEPWQIYGKNQAQALCIIHDWIPEQMPGIFTYQSDTFQPLFTE